MNKIYVLTEGSYSDYRIVGVFKREEKAERWNKLLDNTRVEEYKIGDVDVDVNGYLVIINKDGKVTSKKLIRYAEDNYASLKTFDNSIYSIHAHSTKSFAHAIKTARDKLAQVKAEYENIT